MTAQPLPVRGLHLSAPLPAEVPEAVRFLREDLPKLGVNTLILEINYRFRYTSHPEVADNDPLSRDDLAALAAAARESGIKLVPMINLLGHQSWAKTTFGLLRSHPEFDETSGRYPNNEGIYCRSYCPRHPDLHPLVFDLIAELLAATGATDFHAGMDEVFLLGDDACPRCKGRDKAELFAAEVRALHGQLAASHRTLWIWGDRLIDGAVTGIGEWEASVNATQPAINTIPKDIVIADWHYEEPHPTAAYFALHGFPVVSCPWRKSSVALRQLDQQRAIRRDASPETAARALGMVQTTWTSFGDFLKAWRGDADAPREAREAAACFRELFRELRRQP